MVLNLAMQVSFVFKAQESANGIAKIDRPNSASLPVYGGVRLEKVAEFRPVYAYTGKLADFGQLLFQRPIPVFKVLIISRSCIGRGISQDFFSRETCQEIKT